MSVKNSNLYKAKNAKNDEFYTLLSDVEAELCHYTKHFVGKTVLCNCDNPVQSAFWQYFHNNFAKFGLKKLVSTYYDNGNEVCKTETEDGIIDVVTVLTGDGDFRSEECLDILNECDIVVTNPPFSLFREFAKMLVEHGKKFIIWGNNNAVTYKEIFPLLKDNKMWFGYLANKTCAFRLGDDYSCDEKLTKQIDDGYRYGRVSAISVFTNLDIEKRNEKLVLTQSYSPEKYPKYVNYDAIEVGKVSDIPYNYYATMGVPVTYMCVHNSAQFVIVGNSREMCEKMSYIACKGEYVSGGVRPYIKMVNSIYKYKRLYDRIFIRRTVI